MNEWTPELILVIFVVFGVGYGSGAASVFGFEVLDVPFVHGSPGRRVGTVRVSTSRELPPVAPQLYGIPVELIPNLGRYPYSSRLKGAISFVL